MKKIIYSLLAIILIAGSACKKDSTSVKKEFSEITLADIKKFENQFSKQILISSTTDFILKTGAILIYKTNLNVYGKMKIASEDPNLYEFTFDFVNFKPDGSILNAKSGTSVQPSFYYDLDIGVQCNGLNMIDGDFWLTSINGSNNAVLSAQFSDAKFYIYSN
jgi:hypothetical protein